ncbi:MAG: DUF4019 domain-containing protein [Telluria sp.]
MKHRFWFAAIALAAATLAHAQEDNNVSDASAAAERWLAEVDKGDIAASYDHIAIASKQMVTREQWSMSVKAARAPYGHMESRRMVTAVPTRHLPNAPDGEYVVIQYNTRFDKLPDDQKAIETVIPMRDKDGFWRVSGYFVKTVPYHQLHD